MLGDRPSRLFPQLALLGAIDTATARAAFRRWLEAGDPRVHSALPWWADRGDTASIVLLLRRYDADVARAKAAGRPTSDYESSAARAYLLLARKDTSAARAAFSALPDTMCLRCDFDHLTAARLLAADGSSVPPQDPSATDLLGAYTDRDSHGTRARQSGAGKRPARGRAQVLSGWLSAPGGVATPSYRRLCAMRRSESGGWEPRWWGGSALQRCNKMSLWRFLRSQIH